MGGADLSPTGLLTFGLSGMVACCKQMENLQSVTKCDYDKIGSRQLLDIYSNRLEKPEEGTAEWVLWMMHQNLRKGEKALEQWMHQGRKSEATQQTMQAILVMRKEEGLEAFKEM